MNAITEAPMGLLRGNFVLVQLAALANTRNGNPDTVARFEKCQPLENVVAMTTA
jgi:hypothetical protein